MVLGCSCYYLLLAKVFFKRYSCLSADKGCSCSCLPRTFVFFADNRLLTIGSLNHDGVRTISYTFHFSVFSVCNFVLLKYTSMIHNLLCFVYISERLNFFCLEKNACPTIFRYLQLISNFKTVSS